MARSVWKGPFVHAAIIKHVTRLRLAGGPAAQKHPIRLWSRASTILPEFLGFKFEVHNGMDFVNITVHDRMVGHRFGEFSFTRKYPRFPDKATMLANAAAAAKKPGAKKEK